jgi:ElaB/YqjD/DUF883 family membrane-anchored ribosome-binding protein
MSLANPSYPSPETGQSLWGQDDVSAAPLMPQVEHPGTTAARVTREVKAAQDKADPIAQRATPPLEQLDQGLAHTGEALHGKADQWRATGDEWAECLRGSVREHPLAAVAAALAAGVVIARLAR